MEENRRLMPKEDDESTKPIQNIFKMSRVSVEQEQRIIQNKVKTELFIKMRDSKNKLKFDFKKLQQKSAPDEKKLSELKLNVPIKKEEIEDEATLKIDDDGN